jgi:hypothetical protein
MATKEAAGMAGEAFVDGRKAGVEGTYGQSRNGKGAEKTVVATRKDQGDGGSVDDALISAAAGIYRKAVMNKGDNIGDRALFDR